MTLKTSLIQHPTRLTRLNLIWFHPLLRVGLAIAVLLTVGAAETLSDCSPALAEPNPEADERAPSATDAAVATSATYRSSAADPVRMPPARPSGQPALQDLADVRALHPIKIVPQALAGITLAQSGIHYPTFNAVKLQMATSVDLLPLVLHTQNDYVRDAANQTQRQWLEPQTQPEHKQALMERSSLLLADSGVPAPSDKVLRQGSAVLGVPSVQLQGVFKQEGSDTSARARVTTFYPVTPNAGFGAEVDLTTGNGFADSQETGLNLNELYFAGSLPSLPTLRFVVGLMDLTSYFDRNSFAKDGATHFFNSVFQTNPALAAAGIGSRPGLLVNWSVTDDIDLKATTFSSTRNLGDFHLDAFAGEIGVRFGTAIIRGTYVSSRDAGQRSGFREVFDIPRSGRLGTRDGDREEAYGINAEVFIPSLKLGLFGRYGRYTNLNLDTSGTTYSAGLNFLDVFLPSDRLGLGYGRQLSNDDLRRDRGDKNPDVLELFYDFRITPNLRAAVTLEERNEFTETVVGVRVRTDFDLSPLFRRSR